MKRNLHLAPHTEADYVACVRQDIKTARKAMAALTPVKRNRLWTACLAVWYLVRAFVAVTFKH